MPRKATWPPPVHRHKSGQARVRIKGVDHYLGPYGSEQAQLELARLLERHATGELPRARTLTLPPARTVADVVAEYVAQALPGHSERGKERWQFRRALAVLLALHGSLDAQDLDAEKLDGVRRAMLDGGWAPGVKPWSVRVAARHVVRIRTVWRWAERKGLVPKGSWAHLRTLPPLGPSEPGRRLPPRQAAEWSDLAAVCRELGKGKASARRVRSLLLLSFWSGARPGELRVMRPQDIDRTGPVWLYRPGWHKQDWRPGHDRVVPFGPRCQALLRPLLAGLAPGAWVFPGRDPSRPIRGDSLAQCVRKACERAGVKVVPYQMRHAAKRRIKSQLGLDAARAVLGQAHLDVTDRYDAGGDPKLARDAARRLG